MNDNAHRSDASTTDVTLAGVRFRSPIGLAPIGGGSHWGRPDPDPEREREVCLDLLLQNVRAGSSCVYLNFSYLTEQTFLKLRGGEPPAPAGPAAPGGPGAPGERFMRAGTPVAPYGVEGLFSTVSPGPSPPDPQREVSRLRWQAGLVAELKERKPEGVPIIGGLIGCGGLPDAYVDAARECEKMGVDLLEINFHCPLQAGQRDGVDNALEHRFPPVSQGGLLTESPDVVEAVVRGVAQAVSIPVGAKFSAEVGFPRIVRLARLVRDAGAKYISVGGAAVSIAPPDIYNRGRPLWPFVDGNPFCLTSGSWMRRVCYRDVAAVARFAPGLDIIASGGLVTPQHCVEAMMLGATMAQLCTGVMEQGRGLLRRSNVFLRDFLAEQGYGGARELVGLGLPFVKYAEDLDVLGGRVVSTVDETKCTKCLHCLDNLCVAIGREQDRITVDADKCTGCGACTIACEADAFRLDKRGGDHL
ncbi:MAG: 4Fe-4S binding protein [Thermoleophilia bacterium]|nr:4Fe-4S binding protein [Thermoleophilia bacterium]